MLAIELLQVYFGARDSLSRTFSVSEWQQCYDFADSQAIYGVLFAAIERLPKPQRPVLDQLLDWVGQNELMKNQADEVEGVIHREVARIGACGMKCVVLKGAGLARLYERGIRTMGDVDIWAMADREVICRYCRDNVSGYDPSEEGNMHTSYTIDDTVVELHFTPTYMENPHASRLLDAWIRDYAAMPDNIVDMAGIPTPTLDFNLVYLMLHMYRHYLYEGIGLRHIVDYMVALNLASPEQKRSAYHVLKSLGVAGFAGAVLWLCSECLGVGNVSLDACRKDAWRGRMLWNAVLDGGNFGKADKLNSNEYRTAPFKRQWRFVKRNASLVFAYPGEILWHTVHRVTGE